MLLGTMARHTETSTRATRQGVIRARHATIRIVAHLHPENRRRQRVEREYRHLPVGSLEICSATLRVDCPEIGLHSARPRMVEEQPVEIRERTAMAQRLGHHQSLPVLPVLGRCGNIVTRCVHNSESRFIEPDPHLPGGCVSGIEQSDISHRRVGRLESPDIIVGMPRVAMLP